jgi:hypothetical protein
MFFKLQKKHKKPLKLLKHKNGKILIKLFFKIKKSIKLLKFLKHKNINKNIF